MAWRRLGRNKFFSSCNQGLSKRSVHYLSSSKFNLPSTTIIIRKPTQGKVYTMAYTQHDPNPTLSWRLAPKHHNQVQTTGLRIVCSSFCFVVRWVNFGRFSDSVSCPSIRQDCSPAVSKSCVSPGGRAALRCPCLYSCWCSCACARSCSYSRLCSCLYSRSCPRCTNPIHPKCPFYRTGPAPHSR